MATSLKTTIRHSIHAVLTSSGEGLGNPSVTVDDTANPAEFTNGTTNDKADMVHRQSSSLAASGTETLDMGTGGGMLQPFGAAFEPVELVQVWIQNDLTSLSDLIVGAAGAEPFLGPMGGTAPTTTLKPGEHLDWYRPTGFAVTNNSNDKLKIAASAGSGPATYKKIIVGRSA